MKTKHISKVLVTLLLTLIVASCGYNEDVIEELSISREFAPTDLTARVRNQTIIELDWMVREGIDLYVVEFSADDPNFTTIFETVQVTPDQLPIQVQLEGLTEYSIRVKGISSEGLNDSSWAITTATTLSEQLMLPSIPGDIGYDQATFRWQPGINVTQLILQPGDITYAISAQEKEDGVATVTGLNSLTMYSSILFNNDKPRGSLNFKTEVDPSTGTVINATNDLIQMIANTPAGGVLILAPGDYTSQTSTATLDKSITIRSLLSYNKALVGINFEIIGGATDVSLINLDLNGANTINDVVRFTGVGNFNSLLVSGCNIHDFVRSFIAGNVTGAIVQTVTVENCIVTNILTNGGDFIDFRNSDALNVTVKTSTFNNCAPARDFFRLDEAGTSNGNANCNIILDSCTLYACSDNSSRRILYVRFQTNTITVQNTLIAETDGFYSNQSKTDPNPIFNNNNYFNAPGFFETNTVFDSSTTFTTLNPGFVNAATGNFKITNQTLIDKQVGDPRWRP